MVLLSLHNLKTTSFLLVVSYRNGWEHTEMDMYHTEMDLYHEEMDMYHTEMNLYHEEMGLYHEEMDLYHEEMGLCHAETIGSIQKWLGACRNGWEHTEMVGSMPA
jgi:hypothetical protein